MDTTRGKPPRYSSSRPNHTPHRTDDDNPAAPSTEPEPRPADVVDDSTLADDIDDDPALEDTVSSGAQTPATKIAADNAELERFRREWQREVQSRGQPSSSTATATPAPTASSQHPGTAASQDGHRKADRAEAGASSLDGAEGADPESDQGAQADDAGVGIEDELLANSIPIPEAEIYGPAALKYSKGAHKLPPPRQPRTSAPMTDEARASSTSTIGTNVDATPANGSTATANATHTKSTSPERSRLKDQIATSAIPFSTSSGSSRPLRPKATITGGRIIELDPDAGPSTSQPPPSQANESIQSSIRSAVETYARAVEMERGGQLDEALVSYRRAFKLNSNADRLYHRAQLLISDPDVAPQQSDALLSSPDVAEKVRRALDIDDHRFLAIQERKVREAQAKERGETYTEISRADETSTVPASSAAGPGAGAKTSPPDQLAKLFGKLTIQGGGERDFSQIDFVPEDEEKEVLLSRLPDEILLHVLRMVIAPRGRRGAKIAKPKPPTTDELAAQQARAAGAASKLDRQAGKLTNPAAANPASKSTASEAASGPAAATATATASGEATESSVDKPAAPSRRHLGIGIVLGGADWQALELIGRTCWKLRLLTRSPTLWKEVVRETYYPPILDTAAVPLEALYAQHHHDWRTVFVNQPRVRLNGCYIAACHYARPGMSEESVWIRVVHVVEFYRSIRFLPDGRCLSLLTTEPPSETVRKLEPGLKAKGFARGRWELFPDGLDDDEWEGRPRGPKVTVEDLRDPTMHKYAFRMVFALRQTGRGKWNKLELLEYFSVNLSNGEVLALPQKHSKPFHFSRVIPYGV
ncbi:uncharacterized protein PFL1_01664 [Pseudozyma flocculosa PF-1]|uniref:Related to F-box protein pof7 n=1 Tax=Pseudozyma flocculosa TaxID=84751 RepID=A0A5C3EYD4_9BASI|nr:uncharacterized protein PFL1_01664 [Pseudozyma flocculosa PF-1]EPQ30763.1 hypothetical protein PFL1_01664 [Pseudozyma flocculosa PF-1]SPO36880.1 related to F-box protein pof7 [Pseudozyma flocculosa]